MSSNQPENNYRSRAWLSQYADGDPADIEPEFATMLDAWQAARQDNPDLAVLQYFDRDITMHELDGLSDAFAAGLLDAGVVAGDRVALYLQNVPQYAIALLAIWKCGAVAASVNPMNRQRELKTLLNDCGAKAIVCLQSLYPIVSDVLAEVPTELIITTSELRYQTENDPRIFAASTDVRPVDGLDMEELIAAHEGRRSPSVTLTSNDPAVLTYTSGTTGVPKGAINTHGNLAFNAAQTEAWTEQYDDQAILAIAPFFHVTGLVVHLAIALAIPARLCMTFRFHPVVAAEQIDQKRLTTTVAPITAFIAMMNTPDVHAEQLASMRTISSGGAPVAPQTIVRFQERFGHQIKVGYGLTETSSTSHTAPRDKPSRVDIDSGSVSVGVPVFNTFCVVVDESGGPVAPREVGEILIAGPQVVPAYWSRPEETDAAFVDGFLRTGDVGFMDSEGWFYVVDRKKDMISASGYKVWPREVEDVLYSHPAVREAAVVGIPDDYRGETVKAVISLNEGASVTPEEIIDFCKSQMATYKYPRVVQIIDEVPKNASGKILRRELRDRS